MCVTSERKANAIRDERKHVGIMCDDENGRGIRNLPESAVYVMLALKKVAHANEPEGPAVLDIYGSVVYHADARSAK